MMSPKPSRKSESSQKARLSNVVAVLSVIYAGSDGRATAEAGCEAPSSFLLSMTVSGISTALSRTPNRTQLFKHGIHTSPCSNSSIYKIDSKMSLT